MNKSSLITFKVLFLDIYPDMVKIALFFVHDQHIAEDIVQDVFIKLWEKQDSLHAIVNIKAYIQLAVKNQCINHIQHQQVVDKFQQEYLQQISDDSYHLDDRILLIQQQLQQLPPKRKLILELSIIESKSYKEIASIFDISINTVKDHIKKAYAFLRENVNDKRVV